ncbi:MAG: hypothetical protein PHX83_17255, partial [Acidobacteriia bacterium]|nr:hypothetical protein [Terriglobia bacterium]
FPPNSSFVVVYNNNAGITNSSGGAFLTASNTNQNQRSAYIESEVEPVGNTSHITIGAAALLPQGNAISTAISSTTILPGEIIRVLGIRLNIGDGLIGSQPPLTALFGGAGQVVATVFASPPNAFQIDNVNNFPVATALTEMTWNVTPANSLLACLLGTQTGVVNVSEFFPQAWTTLTQENDPGGATHFTRTPSGSLTTCATATCIGTVNSGSVVFTTASVQVVVQIGNSANPVPIGVTVTGASSVGTTDGGTLVCTSPSGCSFTSVSGTQTKAFVYTMTGVPPNPLLTPPNGTASIPFSFTATTAIITPVPPNTTWVAGVDLGPNTSSGILNFTFFQIPSGSSLTGATFLPIGSLVNCVTNLLCKFLSTASGAAVAGGAYDTGIAIANTSRDIWFPSNGASLALGANPQQGACRLYLFGTGGTIAANPSTTPTFTTPVVTAGTDAIFNLSTTAGVGTGFQGYAIIQCDFQFAHAEIIVADKNFSTFSHGYDCLVIPDPFISGGRFAVPNGFNAGPTLSGESLSEKSGR